MMYGFSFPFPRIQTQSIESGEKRMLKNTINLLPMKYESLDKLQEISIILLESNPSSEFCRWNLLYKDFKWTVNMR